MLLSAVRGSQMSAVSSMKILVWNTRRGLNGSVFFVQIAGVDPVSVNPGLGAQEAFHQLLFAHFEAENADRFANS